ncbi:MAG: hypothetical protein EXR98_10470 [Gemmataceae bacterium]|nr:hypothetical protein [Gemmataceae bacterium]
MVRELLWHWRNGLPAGRMEKAWWALTFTLLAFVAWSYFFQIKNFPHPHGDESSLLNIPYRFCEYGDAGYPAVYAHSFGAEKIRPYPPVAAFTMRNAYHAVVGFSPLKSRVFSALLMLTVVGSAGVFLWRTTDLTAWQRWLVLCQVGLASVMIYTARSMRFEQEVLFAGWIGAVFLPVLISWVTVGWIRCLLWVVAGAALGLAGTSHPFGLIFGIVGVWLLVFPSYWHQQDGLRLWQRLGLLGLGMVLAGIPTFLWVAADWDTFVAFSRAHKKLYADQERLLTDWYAGMPPWNRLRGVLSDTVLAHLTVLHHASYEDFFNYPVPAYRFRLVLHTIFYVQLLLVLGYFLYSVRRLFQNGNPWLHLLVWFALGFIAFGIWYPPIHTYKIYTSFFVNLAGGMIAWRLVAWLRQTAVPQALSVGMASACVAASFVVLHYAAMHAVHLSRSYRDGAYPHATLDQEYAALKEISDHLELRHDDRIVYTYVESWIAAGKNAHSLWESVNQGYVEPKSNADGAVFKNLNVGLIFRPVPTDTPEISARRVQKFERLSGLVSPMCLGGVVLNDFNADGAYSFYVRPDGAPPPLVVARMLRNQQVVLHKAVFEKEVRNFHEPVSLAPGRYVLLAWVQGTVRDDLFEVKYTMPSGAVQNTSVFLTPLCTLVPAPVYVEIDRTQPVHIGLKMAQGSCSLAKVGVLRLDP